MSEARPEERPETRVLGRTDTRAHLIRLQETDPELEAKATAWVAYFERHGVKRSRETILESWGKLEAEAPPWPPTE
jgi:hypothetical protein